MNKIKDMEKKKEDYLKKISAFEAHLNPNYLKLSKAFWSDTLYLVMSGSYYPIPLKKIDITGNIVNSVCSFEMVQHYVNIENIAVETKFMFPIQDNTFISKIKC